MNQMTNNNYLQKIINQRTVERSGGSLQNAELVEVVENHGMKIFGS